MVGLNFGKSVLRQIREGQARDYFNLAGICDFNQEKAKSLARELGVPVFASLEKLLEERELEAIGLFTPPAGRADLIEKCVRSGKHVMTTKPFELDPQKALSVLQFARQSQGVVHLNSPSAQLPKSLEQIRHWQAQHELGRPIACRADLWVSYREKPDGSWYDDPRRCPVAPVFRLGIYLINDLVRLLGMAEKVTLLESRLLTQRPTADNGQLGILFKNGTLANIFSSFCIGDGDSYHQGLVLNYERGTVYFQQGPLVRNQWKGETRITLAMGERGRPRFVEEALFDVGNGVYQWENFYRAIRGETIEGEVTPEEIVEGIKIIQAMTRASEAGGWASV